MGAEHAASRTHHCGCGVGGHALGVGCLHPRVAPDFFLWCCCCLCFLLFVLEKMENGEKPVAMHTRNVQIYEFYCT